MTELVLDPAVDTPAAPGTDRSSAATFNLVTGAVFVAWGLFDKARFGLIIILGACFLVYGAFGMFQSRRLAKER